VATFERLKIMMIGNDTMLQYLVERYAEHSGYDVITVQNVLTPQEICELHPIAILFPSIEGLEIAQSLIVELANCEFSIIVCSSVADITRARELGADHCLAHPLTYDDFSTAMETIKAKGANGT
jgi:DNA-binding response OmpR family regulator